MVCACVVRKPPKTGFLALRPIFLSAHVVSLFCTEWNPWPRDYIGILAKYKTFVKIQSTFMDVVIQIFLKWG